MELGESGIDKLELALQLSAPAAGPLLKVAGNSTPKLQVARLLAPLDRIQPTTSTSTTTAPTATTRWLHLTQIFSPLFSPRVVWVGQPILPLGLSLNIDIQNVFDYSYATSCAPFLLERPLPIRHSHITKTDNPLGMRHAPGHPPPLHSRWPSFLLDSTSQQRHHHRE